MILNLFEILKSVLFGFVEGVTEWLPISSTGHLILLERICWFENVTESFSNRFEVVIQLGAILAVVVLYWKKIWPLRRNIKTGTTEIKWSTIDLWIKIIVACLPAAVIGLLFEDVFDALFYNYVSVAIALIVFGVAFILLENRNRSLKPKIRRLSELDLRTTLLIGVFQVLAAVFPGTSRSGATILGALLIGVSRKTAAEFTFLLAIPVMFGASLLKLVKYGFVFTGAEAVLLLTSMVVAFVVSLLVIRFLLGYVRKHDFRVFGWYRIILGAIVLVSAFFLK